MTKHLTILLLIGLVWGKAEPYTSEIDYYQMGIDAANDDFNSRFYYFAGCTLYGLCLIPVLQLPLLRYPKSIILYCFLMEVNHLRLAIKRN